MKKILTVLFILLLATNAYSYWENEGFDSATPVDLIPLNHGFYTSSATITGSVSAIPLFGVFEGRHNLTIVNSDDFNSIYITDTPFKDSVDAGFEIMANSSISIDIGDSVTDSIVYASTSDSTISVSVSTIEIR